MLQKYKSLLLITLAALVGASGCQDLHAPALLNGGLHGGGNGGGVGGGTQLAYSSGIKDLLVNRCGKCHAPGAAVPNWEDYQTTYNFRSQIYQKVVVDQSMPLQNVTAMTEAERGEIATWINDGAPEDPSGPNPLPTPSSGPEPQPSGSPEPQPSASPTPDPINTVTPPDFAPIAIKKIACLGCHVNNGNAEAPAIARLAGQQPQYLINELQAFKDHSRSSANSQNMMWPQVTSLSANEVQLLALYFWFQTPVNNSASTTPAKVALGKDYFNNGIAATGAPSCAACHGADAHGSDAAPRLAGQNALYIQNQFAAFKASQRPEATTMPLFAPLLTDEQVEDIAQYLQTLQ